MALTLLIQYLAPPTTLVIPGVTPMGHVMSSTHREFIPPISTTNLEKTGDDIIGKVKNKSKKDLTSTISPKIPLLCTLCDISRHTTNQSPSFKELKVIIHTS